MMIQGSQEWLDFRRKKIGGSDAAAIYGCSPWNNALNLWKQKMGITPEPAMSYAMRRGIMLEEPARNLFCEKVGMKFEPTIKVNPDLDWQMASLDGMSACGRYIVEIKCPNAKVRGLAKEGKLPDHYMIQVQHQLAVTGLEMAYYFACEGKVDDLGNFIVGDGYIVEVGRDDRLIAELINAETDFWRRMCEWDPPELLAA